MRTGKVRVAALLLGIALGAAGLPRPRDLSEGARPRHLDRHPARRPPAGLRLSRCCDAGARRASPRRGPLRERLQPRAPHAPVARDDADGPASAAGRRARQHGIRPFAGPPDARRALCAAPDTRCGAAVSAVVLAKTSRIDRGFDFYDDNVEAAAPGLPLGAIQRSGFETRADRGGLGRRACRSALLLLSPPLRAPHAVRRRRSLSRARTGTGRTTARSRRRTRSSGSFSRS